MDTVPGSQFTEQIQSHCVVELKMFYSKEMKQVQAKVSHHVSLLVRPSLLINLSHAYITLVSHNSKFYTINNVRGRDSVTLLFSYTEQIKNTIHQLTTMLLTPKNVLFPDHNHLLTTGADDLSL